MIFRKATMKDIPAIVHLVVEWIERTPALLTIDRDGIREAVRECLGPAHFTWVTEVDGKVVAAVMALTNRSFWFTRLQCSLLLCYSKVPGAGLPLLREFIRWMKGRPAIRLANVELDMDVDPRIVKFLKRAGFSHEGQNLTYLRGA